MFCKTSRTRPLRHDGPFLGVLLGAQTQFSHAACLCHRGGTMMAYNGEACCTLQYLRFEDLQIYAGGGKIRFLWLSQACPSEQTERFGFASRLLTDFTLSSFTMLVVQHGNKHAPTLLHLFQRSWHNSQLSCIYSQGSEGRN